MKQRILLFLFSIVFTGLQAQDVPEQQTPLVTKITATWCSNCGSWGWNFFKDILNDNRTKAILIGAHDSGDLQSSVSVNFSNNFSAIGQPKFYLNNTDLRVTRNGTAGKRTEVKDMIDAMSAQSPVANVGFYAEMKDGNINVRTNTKFFQDGGANDYYLGLYVVENHVRNSQSGQSGTVEHPFVIRSSFTSGSFGEILDASGTIASGTEISRDFSTAINTGWNTDNVSVMAVIWKENGGKFEFVNAAQTNDFSGIPTSDVEVISEVEKFEVFPTVVTEKAAVKINLTEAVDNLQVHIFDLSGKVVSDVFRGTLPSGEHLFEVDRNAFLESGIYFISLNNGNKVMTEKLILK